MPYIYYIWAKVGSYFPLPLCLPRAMRTFADLFCGIGGFHYAAANLGLQCVFACDINEAARKQYIENFGIQPERDIYDVIPCNVPDHDLLFAGFPCQPFSIIGDRKGLDDPRGTLAFEIIKILRAKLPKVFVLENVRQFSTMGGGQVIEKLLIKLRESGYDCTWKVLNALDFGLPQKRERTIIVGFADRLKMEKFKWPTPTENRIQLSEILEDSPDPRFFASEYIRNKRLNAHTPKITPSIWHENKGGNISSHPFSCALRAGASHNYLLVNGERRLTPREMLRLQGFPESFKIVGTDSQLRRQVGNAIPVHMAQAVISEVLNADKNTRRIQKAGAVSA